ncbi:MAG: hypothetical protein J5765_02575 [Clostridia bacterium]|nr:hypothetical protein [Clostridia bacterium]
MKKFIIVLLLLIPLIVIFTISASGKIISAEVSISIENIELWHKGEPVSEVTINYGEYHKKKLKYQLIPRYYPGVADVSGFRWYSDDESVATVDKDGIVTFLDCGFVKITAQSLDAASVRASCAFFVEDDSVHKLALYSYDSGEEVRNISLSVYEQSIYRAEITPYSALAEDVDYSSSDESVFAVSPIGVLTAKKQGAAILTVGVTDKKNKRTTIEVPVTVSGVCPVKQKQVYAYQNAIDLTPYLADGAVAQGGSAVSVASMEYGESREIEVTLGDKRETLTLTRLDYEKKLGIAEFDLLLRTMWEQGVFLAVDHSVCLTAVDLATSAAVSGVTITSLDPDVIAVEGNTLRARRAGKTTVRFEKADYQTVVLEVTVATPLSYFALNFDVGGDLVGLGSERVFGTRSVYDGEIVNGIRVIPEQIYPATGALDRFIYSVKEDYASVDKTGLVTFTNDAIGREVTVMVKSPFSTNGIVRHYTFRNIVKGINVGFGFGANPCDPDKEIYPSYEPYYHALKTMYEPRDEALVFQTNVYMPSQQEVDSIEGQYHKISFIRDMYGNGYKMDGQFYQYDYESMLFAEGKDEQLEGYEDQKGITICDLFVNSYAPLGSDSKETFKLLMKTGGTPIRTYYSKRTDFAINFKFCVFQYSYSHVITIGGTVTFDGCIFRNSAGVSILVESLYGQENYVTVNNCIFSNSISMPGLVSNGTFPLGKNEVVEYNAFHWTGRNYVYNWKKIDEVRLDIIPTGVMKNESLDTVLEKVNDKLSECARISLKMPENADLVVRHKLEKEKYVNMGVMFMNFWAEKDWTPEEKIILNKPREKITDGMLITFDESTTSLLELEMETAPLGAIATLANAFLDLEKPLYMLMDKNADGEYLTSPGETYKLDEETYAKLRGKRD